MDCTAKVEGTIATVKLEGRFTFDHRNLFKSAALPLLEAPGVREVQVDLARLTFMDASCLGMLLLLREKADARGLAVSLRGASPDVRAVLKTVQFDRLFDLRD